MVTFITITALVLLVLSLLVTFSIRHDRHVWNKGKCKCGSDWYHKPSDSQGGRIYVCPKCGECIWISYPVEN